MIRDFKFMNFDAGNSDFDSKDGEIMIPANLWQNTDGTYGPGLTAVTMLKIPEGYEAVAIHDTPSQSNIILRRSSGNSSILSWAHISDNAEAGNIIEIGTVPDINCVEISTHIIVIATSDGLRYLVWDGKGYRCVDLTEAMPVIEFGLKKAGTLTGTDTFVIPGVSANTGSGGIPGSGASRPHPSAETERDDYSATFHGIAKAYREAVDEQILSKGYFHQPFFLRYALRMTDGTHILPSAPILMLPNVLPPLLGLNAITDSENRCTITTEFSSVKFFELVYRITDELDQSIKPMIAAIDIFATPGIPTFDDARLDDGYITTYSRALDARNTTPLLRGTRNNSRANDEIFEGHYSDGDDRFTAHYINRDTLGRKAFMVHPNLNFHRQISTAADFYKIASVPYSTTDGFGKLEILSTDFSMIEKGERMRELPLSHHKLIATALLVHESTLIAAVSGAVLPKPFPMKSIRHAHYSPDLAIEPTVTVTVFSRIGSEVKMTSCQCSCGGTSLTEAIPRYVFYPDPRAFMMTFSDGNTRHDIPLASHETLYGSFWSGGTEADYLPETALSVSREATEPETTSPDHTKAIMISDRGNIFAFDTDSISSFTQATVTGILTATKAPKSGTFGRHNLYAFSIGGIWMLEYLSGKVKTAQKISSLACKNKDAIVEAGGIVVFTSGGKLFSLDGSDIKEIHGLPEALAPVALSLPHHCELMEEAGMTANMVSSEEYFENCGLIYEENIKAVVTYDADKGYTIAYSPHNHSWATASLRVRGKIMTTGGYLAIGGEHGIIRLGRETERANSFTMTRPIKLTSPMAAHDIRSIELLGFFRHGEARLAAYGTRDTKKWHLTGSSECHYIEDFNSAGYRMLRLCIAARLAEGDYLYGVRITADD